MSIYMRVNFDISIYHNQTTVDKRVEAETRSTWIGKIPVFSYEVEALLAQFSCLNSVQ